MKNSPKNDEEDSQNSFLGKKTKNPDSNNIKNINDSSGSNSFGFQISQNEEEITFEYKHIYNKKDLKEKLSTISSPCTIKNEILLDKISKEAKVSDKTFKLSKSLFKDIKDEDIKYINTKFVKNEEIDMKNRKIFYFSSSIIKSDNKADLLLFNKIHNYKTGYTGCSKISDFCFNKEIYFPFSGCDEYMGYKRAFSHCFREHHFHEYYSLGKIVHHFGPKGVGKSICARATIYNYLHFDLLKLNQKVFFPAIFFDLKIWKKNWKDKIFLMNILKYEFMNLWESIKEWEHFFSEFEKELKKLSPISVFDIIDKLIKFFFQKRDSKLLVVLDHYSLSYDKNNELQQLCKKCKDKKKFDIFIIYEINSIQDQEKFLYYFKDETTVMHSILPYGNYYNNQVEMDQIDTGIIYKYELRGAETLEQIKKRKDLIPIPENYEIYFGENVSFYFKYLALKNNNNNIDFQEFVNDEKNEIKTKIFNFIESEGSDSGINMFQILNEIIINVNTELSFNNLFFKYIDSSYFLFDKIEGKDGEKKCIYNYSIPLIKDIYNDIKNLFNDKYFIDIRDPEFLKLDGISMGILFDKHMNRWFKLHVSTGFLDFLPDDIINFELDYLIKKNSKSFNITEMFAHSYIKQEVDHDAKLMKIKENSSKVKNKKCIIIFQEFNGKSIDICFIIKRNNNDDIYSINSLQIKCSDSFDIDEDLLRNNRYEMTYLRNKIEYLLNIKISEAFITYMSIAERKKACAEKYYLKFFFYNIAQDTLVDYDNNKIENFPFYEDCKIEFIDLEDILKLTRQMINYMKAKINFFLEETSEEYILVNGQQIKNSVIIKIKNESFNITINVENKINNFVGENEGKYQNWKYYFIIKFHN